MDFIEGTTDLFFSLSTVTDISKWNVSKVTTLHSTFKFATLFNSNISNWATSKVVSLVHTFDGAAAFNGGKCPSFNGVFYFIHKESTTDLLFLFQLMKDISKWDVSKVTTLYAAFYSATLFNSNISNWATSKVVNLVHIFDGAAAFNGGKCPILMIFLILFTK